MQNEEVIKQTTMHMDRLLRKIIEEKSKMETVELYSNEWTDLKKRLDNVTREWQSFLKSLP